MQQPQRPGLALGPGARLPLGAALASASVVVKALCASVLLLYLLSFALDTAVGLAVTPGYLFPPNFWVWTLATHGLVELHMWDVALSLATVVAAGQLLEPLWGALELLVFFAVVNVSVGLLGAFAYLLTYMASFNLAYLFTVRIHGVLGFLGGVLVALKQTMGDSVVLKVPQVRMRVVPMLLLVSLMLLRLTPLVDSSALASYDCFLAAPPLTSQNPAPSLWAWDSGQSKGWKKEAPFSLPHTGRRTPNPIVPRGRESRSGPLLLRRRSGLFVGPGGVGGGCGGGGEGGRDLRKPGGSNGGESGLGLQPMLRPLGGPRR
ncbi:transmembrane protein 115-like [Gracilinanus agilis]|uniref:transmembrane protein 115-like n=1 Tax=Gracilinanus agilis TaxID=191870 RepID=UPI001CFEB5DA|nr:transmembrane protein 115-like [Gracilinanus agilis]